MPKYCVFNAEILKKLIKGLVITAFADEPTTTEPTSGDSNSNSNSNNTTGNEVPSVDFEAMIARARKEEKDKLYPRLTHAEEEVKRLEKSVNKYLLENAALKEALEEAKKKSEDNTEVTELQNRVAELEKELEEAKKAPNEEELRKAIEAEYDVKMYAKEQIEANKGEILSMFIPDITGKSREEIDTALASAKEKTLSVKKDLGLLDDDKKPSKKKQATEKPAKVPPANPAEDSSGVTYDAEYIRNLDPRSEEYKEFRKSLGLK